VKLTRENTAIVLDSTGDFPEAPERFRNWRIVPLYVSFGQETYRDYVELSPDEFYAKLRAAETLPTTSQPTPGDFLACYEGLAGYERVYSLHISGTLSGTVESARTAVGMLGGDQVRVVDTEQASAAVAMLGLAIQRRLDAGTTDEEIEALLTRFRAGARLIFTVETLEYLAKGGRIGRARAWAGQLLNVKPILALEAGEIVPVKRVRGNQKAMQEFVSAFSAESEDVPELHVAAAHADAPAKAEALVKMVRDLRPRAQIDLVSNLGSVVGTHAGPGAVGFFWFTDSSL
jgi:DegV family protein with EDD domain